MRDKLFNIIKSNDRFLEQNVLTAMSWRPTAILLLCSRGRMSNNSSPRVPPNHPFLIRTPPPVFCKDFQAPVPSPPTPCADGPTSQSASAPNPQFGRAPIFGSTDIRERKKIPSTPLPTVNTRSNPHQPRPAGAAYIHTKALVCSSPSRASHNPTELIELSSVTPSGKSSIQQLDLIKYPSQEAGINSSSQDASTPTFQNTQSPPTVPHFQQSHPTSWSPGSDAGIKMKQEEEAIVSEALAFLQEHMRKKAAENDSASGFEILKEVVKKHHGEEDDSED